MSDGTRRLRTLPNGALDEDPKWAHVVYGGRLGEVVSHHYDYNRGGAMLVVRYFDGSPWPLVVPASEARLLVRDE